MKVLLIDPEGIYKGYNIGLGYLSAVLTQNAHETRVIDLRNRTDNIHKRVLNGLKWKPDIIGVSIQSFTAKSGISIIKFCKEHYNGGFYLAGGPYITIKKEAFLKENSEFDCVTVGESEVTIIELLNALEKKKDLESVKGIIYRKKGKKDEIIKTSERGLIENIDTLPLPNYRLFDSTGKYMYEYQIVTSRGCPYNCVFCLNKELWGRRWRYREPEKVVEELIYAKKEYGALRFRIQDDNFTLVKERAKKILNMIIEKKLNLKFTLPNGIRADKVDEELAFLLKKAGCEKVAVGIENGDKQTFDYVKKGETLADIERGVDLLKNAGLEVYAFMIIGLINTDYDSVMRSLKFAKKLKIQTAWYIAIPFRHTELYDWVKEHGEFLMDTDMLDGNMWAVDQPVAFVTPNFSAADKMKAFYIANSECGNYEFLVYRGNYFQKVLHIAKVLWKYNKKKYPDFALFLLKKILSETKNMVEVGFARRSLT